jgi:Uma2 family endonuclease
MNKPVLIPRPEAPSRHRFTVDDVFRMQDAGVLGPEHRCELIHGELIDMPSEGDLHSFWKGKLTHSVARLLDPDLYGIGPDTTFYLDTSEAPEPDLFIVNAGVRPSEARGDTVLLVIEIADTSLAFDLSSKADLYAAYGVREYWVLDVQARRTLVHLLKPGGGYGAPLEAPFDADISATLIPQLSLRFADLG